MNNFSVNELIYLKHWRITESHLEVRIKRWDESLGRRRIPKSRGMVQYPVYWEL